MNTPLFRSEVLAAQQAQWLGTIRLTRPLPFALITIIGLTLATALIVFLAVGEYTRKVRVNGSLQPQAGALRLVATSSGVISEIKVKEGGIVKQGDALFAITSEKQSSQGDTQAALSRQIDLRRQSMQSERRARGQQEQERLQSISTRIIALDSEASQISSEIELQHSRLQLAKTGLARHQQLADNGFISALQLQQKQEDHIDQNARLQALERSRISLMRERKNLQLQKLEVSAQSQNELAQLDRQLALLDMEQVENESRRETTITAPKAGTVHAIAYTAGQTVAAGNALASIVPLESQLEAQLYVPSRAMGFVGKGQKVLVRYAAFPYQKYGLQHAIIHEVTQSPMTNGQDAATGAGGLNTGLQASDSIYRVTARLAVQAIDAHGQINLLKPGMALDADIVQDKRKIYEWFFEPILGFRKNMAT